MTTCAPNPEKNENSLAEAAGQELFELELRIARRADELAKTAMPLQDRNFEFWLRAEREIIAEMAGSWLVHPLA